MIPLQSLSKSYKIAYDIATKLERVWNQNNDKFHLTGAKG